MGAVDIIGREVMRKPSEGGFLLLAGIYVQFAFVAAMYALIRGIHMETVRIALLRQPMPATRTQFCRPQMQAMPLSTFSP